MISKTVYLCNTPTSDVNKTTSLKTKTKAKTTIGKTKTKNKTKTEVGKSNTKNETNVVAADNV